MGKKPSQPIKKKVPVQEQEEYFMDKIWERRTEPDGTMRYLTSWIGFDASEKTWEPIEHFTDSGALALVLKFKEEMDKAKAVDHCVRANLNRARKSVGDDADTPEFHVAELRSFSDTPHRSIPTISKQLAAVLAAAASTASKRRKSTIGNGLQLT
ncbi:hypothetical protein PRIPAC_87232 [Pristionchus pacificus]|uniref:Chromo domain-containing protein n=1 Tax=Pristionchus pacificus TaxID=54126 RepID=A0A454XS88_PRIPA|nr:hypothetical protein PRIPAC_87232 [Pristionchus pacificus]|eukprot:PDM82194.1 hypothetical protein PRIPAC_36587 [Pristionchus pacificus]